MKKEAIHPEGLMRRPMYSQVVRVGNTLYISGQVARDENGNAVGAGDFRTQIEKVFENLQIALNSAGASLSDVVSTTTYLTNMAYVPVWGEVTAKYYGTEAPPTSTVLIISSLASADFLLEIQAVAVVE